MGRAGSKWRHNWVPVNMAAARMKAHGSKSGAVRVLGSSKSRAAATRKVAASTRKAQKAITPKRTRRPQGWNGKSQLSEGYLRGRGASEADVQHLISAYVTMHGRAPTAKQIASIRRRK